MRWKAPVLPGVRVTHYADLDRPPEKRKGREVEIDSHSAARGLRAAANQPGGGPVGQGRVAFGRVVE